MGKLEESIDRVLESGDIKEEATELFGMISSNYERAEKKTYARFTIVLVLWLMLLLLDAGGMSEFSVFGVKLANLDALNWLLPSLVAFSFYGMIASYVSFSINLFILRRLISKRWPGMVSEKIDDILLPPTIFSVEVFIRQHLQEPWRTMDMAWKVILSAVFALLPLAIVVHSQVVFVTGLVANSWLVVLCVILNGLVVARALVLAVQTIIAFGED